VRCGELALASIRRRGDARVHRPADQYVRARAFPAVQVTALDANNNTATSFTGNVTVAIRTNAGAVRSPGPPRSRRARGRDLRGSRHQQGGTGYTLTASGPSLTPVASSAFDITPGAAATLVFTDQRPTRCGRAITPAVQVTARCERQHRDRLHRNVTSRSGPTRAAARCRAP